MQYPLLNLSDYHFSIFFYQKCFYSFMLWIMGYWFMDMITQFEDQFLTLPNLDFITAHSSLITAQMGSVITVKTFQPYFGHLSCIPYLLCK